MDATFTDEDSTTSKTKSKAKPKKMSTVKAAAPPSAPAAPEPSVIEDYGNEVKDVDWAQDPPHTSAGELIKLPSNGAPMTFRLIGKVVNYTTTFKNQKPARKFGAAVIQYTKSGGKTPVTSASFGFLQLPSCVTSWLTSRVSLGSTDAAFFDCDAKIDSCTFSVSARGSGKQTKYTLAAIATAPPTAEDQDLADTNEGTAGPFFAKLKEGADRYTNDWLAAGGHDDDEENTKSGSGVKKRKTTSAKRGRASNDE